MLEMRLLHLSSPKEKTWRPESSESQVPSQETAGESRRRVGARGMERDDGNVGARGMEREDGRVSKSVKQLSQDRDGTHQTEVHRGSGKDCEHPEPPGREDTCRNQGFGLGPYDLVEGLGLVNWLSRADI